MIEGIDGSGKTLQSGLLIQKLVSDGYAVDNNKFENNQISLLGDQFKDRGYKVETEDFPRYKTSVWGKLVGRMLIVNLANYFR